MSEPLEPLDELTLEFLKSVNYPRVHMMWSEWLEKAKVYGLSDQEIVELEQYLEENKQLTSPVRFEGKQWWLTRTELQHLELIRQYYSSGWETKVYQQMDRLSLGDLERDWELKTRMKGN